MKKLRIYLLAALGVAVLGATMTLTNAGQAVADGMRPLLVRDVENPARLAVQSIVDADAEEGVSVSTLGFADLKGSGFPSGKRLVIENVTIKVRVPAGQKAWAQIVTPLNGGLVFHSLAMTSQGVFAGEEVFIGTHQTRLYADRTAAVPWGDFATHVNTFRSDNTGPWNVVVTISGHFVDRN